MIRILPLICALLIWSCTTPQTATPTDQRQLRIGTRIEPDTLNPYISNYPISLQIAKRLYPTLFYEEPILENGIPKLTPYLVTTSQWNEAKTELQLTISDQLRWSDGQPLTTDDIAFSLETHTNKTISSFSEDHFLTSWEVLSKTEIKIHFSQAALFNEITLNEVIITPRHYFGKIPYEQWFEHDWSNPQVVFGPYTIANYTPGEKMILKPLKQGTAPDLGIVFIRDRETLTRLLLSDQLDIAWGLPLERLEEILAKKKSIIYPNLTYFYLGYNPIQPGKYNEKGDLAALEELKRKTAHPVLGDVRVRKALTHAMNRQSMLKKFWGENGLLPATPWRAGLAYATHQQQPLNYDPEQAKALLVDAGWDFRDGAWFQGQQKLEFTVICNAGSTIREQYLLAIQKDLAKIGITMNIDLQEAGRYQDNCARRNFDAMFGAYYAGTRPGLASLYHSDAALGKGNNNISWTAGDHALAQVKHAQTIEALRTSLQELEERFAEDHPLTMLFGGLEIGAQSKDLPKVKSNYSDKLYRAETW